ncbi:hypothetical protein [Priestia endophytica]|uniref:hypothetical protein n=1 Tax=Priestia endophytica TaxID=135735 RepID=UPI000DCA7FE0|nr:hypothetical protein [Priestia endophytica]RAS75722.1 hypothetical protein A4R27_21985 [Priestia endophytica]
MSDLKQLQLLLDETRIKYERYVKRFGNSSFYTQKVAQQLYILVRLENEYFQTLMKKDAPKNASMIY